jgi:transposase
MAPESEVSQGKIMPFKRRRKDLHLTEEEKDRLGKLRRSRTAEKRRVMRASILLDSIAGLSDQAVAARNHVNRNTVALCISKCLESGVEAALSDLRPGRAVTITNDAKAWVVNLACRKPLEFGYSYELWTYSLLREHVRANCGAAGYKQLSTISRSKLHRILEKDGIKAHKVRYYVERRDPDFESKMSDILHVYKEVEIINNGLISGEIHGPPMVTISYDEKPGIQAIETTGKELPPVPGNHSRVTRDYEYVRHGTVSLLAGIDLHTGIVTEVVRDSHASSDFIAFLQKLDEAYPADQTLRLVLDNHSAHISKETRKYLATRPQRFTFVFTPKHGSWLNIVESLFSKMTRTFLRGIRVRSAEELIERIHKYFEEINARPVVFRWKYKMDEITMV